MNQSEFLDKARLKHGDEYDYSLVEYKSIKELITVVCRTHGKFVVSPDKHLARSQGCGICKKQNKAKRSGEQFIKKANIKYSGKYVYDDVLYVNVDTPVTINCPTHGDFTQTPYNHLHYQHGCRKCGKAVGGVKNSMNILDFIMKARRVQTHTYNYSKVDFSTVYDSITITCPIHGDFNQTATDHLRGRGCKKCSHYGFNLEKSAILYYVSVNKGQAYKIGITNKTVKDRFTKKDFNKMVILKEVYFDIGEQAYMQEQAILKEFAYAKYTGEPLLESGNTELFNQDILLLDC